MNAGPPVLVDGVMPRWSRWLESRPVLDFVDYNLRGVGQVVFMNNPITGLLILTGLWLTSAWLGFAATVGLVASTGTALVFGFDRGGVRAGLFGFNGVLTGAGLATFVAGEFDSTTVAYIVGVAAFSTVVTAALTRLLLPTLGLPPLTLPFNLATLAFLLAAFGFVTGDLDAAAVEPRLPEVDSGIDPTLRDDQGAIGGAAGAAGALLGALVGALLRGVSQVFLSDSVLSGVLIVVGMVFCSRIAATAAILGSLVGLLTGLAVGADGAEVYQGLWGYNPVLSAIAIAGVFYVLTWRSALLAGACAVVTAFALATVGTLLAPFGLPALTLPFCLATLAFLLAGGASSRLLPVAPEQVSTPEAHRDRVRRT